MFDIQDLVHLEQDFFDAGYKDGYAHGRIHGLIEGRALGREKGFEIWEEIGFYEGFALTWKKAYENTLSRKNDDGKGLAQTVSLSSTSVLHIRQLLQLISQFPKVNPSSITTHNGSDIADPSNPRPTSQESELDVSALLNNIRSRYKALCASLGVRPRVVGSSVVNTDMKTEGDASDGALVSNRTGTTKPKRSIWKIDIGDEKTTGNDTPGDNTTVSSSKPPEMSF